MGLIVYTPKKNRGGNNKLAQCPLATPPTSSPLLPPKKTNFAGHAIRAYPSSGGASHSSASRVLTTSFKCVCVCVCERGTPKLQVSIIAPIVNAREMFRAALMSNDNRADEIISYRLGERSYLDVRNDAFSLSAVEKKTAAGTP